MGYTKSKASLGKQIRNIYTSYALDALDTESRDALKYYSKLAGSEKFSFDKRINGMHQWVNDYLSSDAPEQNKQVAINAMHEMNRAVRNSIMTENLANAKYLPLIGALDDTIAQYAPAPKAKHFTVVKKEPVPWYDRFVKPAKAAAAAGILALAGTAAVYMPKVAAEVNTNAPDSRAVIVETERRQQEKSDQYFNLIKNANVWKNFSESPTLSPKDRADDGLLARAFLSEANHYANQSQRVQLSKRIKQVDKHIANQLYFAVINAKYSGDLESVASSGAVLGKFAGELDDSQLQVLGGKPGSVYNVDDPKGAKEAGKYATLDEFLKSNPNEKADYDFAVQTGNKKRKSGEDRDKPAPARVDDLKTARGAYLKAQQIAPYQQFDKLIKEVLPTEIVETYVEILATTPDHDKRVEYIKQIKKYVLENPSALEGPQKNFLRGIPEAQSELEIYLQPEKAPAQPAAPAAVPVPAVQPAAPAATPAPVVPKNLFTEDRAALSMDIGSMRASQDREAALDLRAYGLTILAQGHADKYREETSLDKIRETGFGLYAKADLDEMIGVPVEFGASAYMGTQTRKSQESQLQEDANFRIATVTDTKQEDPSTYLTAFGKVKLSDTTIGATVFRGSNETKVGVTTDLDVVNKNDPAGNYHRNWTDAYKFLTDTTGMQLSLDQLLAKGIDVGAYFTLDLKELKEMQRNANTYTLDVFLKAMTEDNKYGASVLIGQGLLDDNGEQNDMFTKPRYSLVAGAELANWLTLGLQFNRMENPDGSLMFLIGANGALPYMINNRWTENLSRLDLLRDMSPELQKVYLRGLFNDFTWAIAQQNVWAVSGDVGARRVMTLDEGAKTVFDGSATLYIPVHSTFTGTVTPFIKYEGLEGLVEDYGVILGGHAVGQRWHFFVEASREKADGRSQKDEAFRAVGGIAFPFGK